MAEEWRLLASLRRGVRGLEEPLSGLAVDRGGDNAAIGTLLHGLGQGDGFTADSVRQGGGNWEVVRNVSDQDAFAGDRAVMAGSAVVATPAMVSSVK